MFSGFIVFSITHIHTSSSLSTGPGFNTRPFLRESINKQSRENSDGTHLWDLHSIKTDSTYRSTDFRENTGGMRHCLAVTISPMVEELILISQKSNCFSLVSHLEKKENVA